MDARVFVTEYLKLGLRFDKLAAGFVDAYAGDPQLRNRVAAESKPNASELATRARSLRVELSRTDISQTRGRFLTAQLVALECSGRRLAGQPVPFRAEVRDYFQVDIGFGDQDVYRRAHADLADALPGTGPLCERVAAARERDRVPVDALQRCVRTLSAELRERVRHTFGLPVQESVDYELVNGKPWSALHHYRGGYRSRVLVNTDSVHRMASLAQLIAHESYPGHHTQHCHSDQRCGYHHGGGETGEHAIHLVNTPQCLLAEGLADLGLRTVIGPGWGAWAERLFAEIGLRMDGATAERIEEIMVRLRPVRQDAALMLHERGDQPDEVVAFVQRWLLLPKRRAEHVVEFLRHPLWRAYTTTYAEGSRLVSSWLHAGSDTDVAGRYVRLLDQPRSPQMMRDELAGVET